VVYVTGLRPCNGLVAKQSSPLFAENRVLPLNLTDMRCDRQWETDDDDRTQTENGIDVQGTVQREHS